MGSGESESRERTAVPQRDYILRMIEQLGAALIELRKAIMGGAADTGTVEDRLRHASASAGMDLDLARAASPDALHVMIAPTGEVDPLRCWVLAEMFLTDGVHRLEQGDDEASERALEKAAVLFRLLGSQAHLAGYPEADERLEEIETLRKRSAGGDP